MKRKQRRIAIAAMLLLLVALCVPVLSGARAEGTTEPLIVPIDKATEVFKPDGEKIGVLSPTQAGGNTLTISDTERYPALQVLFDYATASKATAGAAVLGKTLVLFQQAEANSKQNGMPGEGWIDVTLVVKAQAARHAIDLNQIAKLGEQLATFESGATQSPSSPSTVVAAPVTAGIFNADEIAIWAPLVALALGVIAVSALVWLAISAATTAWETERQTRYITKITDALTNGVAIQAPLKMELSAWPRGGQVSVSSEALEQLAAIARLGGVFGAPGIPSRQQQPAEPTPLPVREGEEPELLALANRLAGVASAPEWNGIVREAGWRAVQLQSNPTEKGTYVADESGYSIIACLLCGAEPEFAYVVPSYQDPNASEPRWSEFYMVNEDMSVKNYYVEALPVMYIERGTFFLQKSKGKLTRRPQYH